MARRKKPDKASKDRLSPFLGGKSLTCDVCGAVCTRMLGVVPCRDAATAKGTVK